MAGEYVNPKYAKLVREFRAAQVEALRAQRTMPVRGFITTPPTSGK